MTKDNMLSEGKRYRPPTPLFFDQLQCEKTVWKKISPWSHHAVHIKCQRSGIIEKSSYINAQGHAECVELAIYLTHDKNGVTVLDQWNSKGKPSRRTIYFKKGLSRSNEGQTVYVIQ